MGARMSRGYVNKVNTFTGEFDGVEYLSADRMELFLEDVEYLILGFNSRSRFLYKKYIGGEIVESKSKIRTVPEYFTEYEVIDTHLRKGNVKPLKLYCKLNGYKLAISSAAIEQINKNKINADLTV